MEFRTWFEAREKAPSYTDSPEEWMRWAKAKEAEDAASAARGLGQFIRPDGQVVLYHFMSGGGLPEIMSEPSRFGASSFTRRDKSVSSVPRIFFYSDLNDKEHELSGRPLYKTLVPADRIYDLVKDPLGLKEQAGKNDVLNATRLVDVVNEHPDYDGMYYKTNAHIVNWFNKLKLQITDEKQELERQSHVPMDYGSSIKRAS